MPRAAAGSAGAKKGRAPKAHKLPERFPSGEVLNQSLFAKKKWQLGDVIGQGGFGLIYKAYDVTDGPANHAQPYVIKIEPLDNGPLFCEFHFYQRVARPELITEWTKVKKLRYLAVPQFLGSGQHKKGDKQYRYLVMPCLSSDLQKIFEKSGRSFSEKTTFSVGLRMLDALEFIHDKGYCHADIKASNILLGYNNGKTDFNQVFLIDYGLAYRFLVDGAQKPYKEDPKRAHDGTAEYASRDAHKGVFPARRGDLEILGYCMLEWLAGTLPWKKFIDNKDKVRDFKIKFMNDLPDLFKTCFGTRPYPEGLKKYFGIVSKLAYDEKPNYSQLRSFLRSRTNNEWSLGLSDGASPSKGVKRKSDSAGQSTPKKRSRPSSSPATPRQTGAKRAAKVATSKSKPALVNGSSKSTPSTPRSKARTAKAAGIPSAAWAPVTSAKLVPGSSKTKAGPAKALPAVTKIKSPPAGKSRKQTPKSSASSPAGSRLGSAATKGKTRTPQKAGPVRRKRNKKAASSDTAVQTSPGFGLPTIVKSPL